MSEMKNNPKRTRTDAVAVAPSDNNSSGLRRTKRSKSCVEKLGTDLRIQSPMEESRSKKRKKVTLTMTPDPDEEPVAAKRIKIEAIDRLYGAATDIRGRKEVGGRIECTRYFGQSDL